ncbi:PQQ-binding-like beta-propeller repeat protein [Amaricoccus macauensis]|uniref:outer membrane protein assembly factor BamB family protein n=1 Tax=Amaricoccus macauensis TaxID=57001 RepID=UPI003C7A1B99
MGETVTTRNSAAFGLPRFGVLALAAVLAIAGCDRGDKPLPGEREPVRPQTGILDDAAAPTRARPISLPAAITNADWAQRNGTAAGRLSHPALAPLPQIRWTRDIGEGSGRRSKLVISPVAAGGLVFAVDAAAQLSALTPQGETVWSLSLVPEGQRPDAGPGGGLGVSGGVLYASTGFGEVFAISAGTGQILWRETVEAPIRSAPVIEGGRVTVVLGDDRAMAFSASDGSLVWEVSSTGGTGLMGGATPAVSGGLTVIPFASGEIRGVSASGGLWQWATVITMGRLDLARSAIGDISGDPVFSGSSVFASSQNGRTIRIDRNTGERLWTMPEGAYGPVWPAGGSIFLVSDESRLVRADASQGTEIWAVDLPDLFPNRNWLGDRQPFRAITHFGPILAGGRLWVASGDAMLRAYSPTDGALLAEIPLPAGAAAPPIVAGGIMYVVTEDAELIALQ